MSPNTKKMILSMAIFLWSARTFVFVFVFVFTFAFVFVDTRVTLGFVFVFEFEFEFVLWTEVWRFRIFVFGWVFGLVERDGEGEGFCVFCVFWVFWGEDELEFELELEFEGCWVEVVEFEVVEVGEFVWVFSFPGFDSESFFLSFS